MTSTSTSKQIGKVALTPAGNWDNTNEYEKLDVVYYQGDSYVAKKAVPVATNITNEEYWQTLAEKAPNLAIGTVTTVSADTGASASIGGTADSPTLNLSIPRGIPGNESIDDTAGEGDTDKVWSADKSYSVKSDLQDLTIRQTETSLKGSVTTAGSIRYTNGENDNGSSATASYSRSNEYILVSKGDVIVFQGIRESTGHCVVAFYDESKTYDQTRSVAGEGVNGQRGFVIIDKFGYIRIGCRNAELTNATFTIINNTGSAIRELNLLHANATKSNFLTLNVGEILKHPNTFLNGTTGDTGSITTRAIGVSDLFPCKEGDVLSYKLSVDENYGLIVTYDKDLNFIRGFVGSGSSIYIESTLTFQSGEKYFRVSAKTNEPYKNNYYLKYSTTVTKFTEIDNRLTDLEDGYYTLPDYWKTYLDGKIATLQGYEAELDKKGVEFAFVTDCHVPVNQMQSPKILRYLYDRMQFPYVINGGDWLDAGHTKAEAIDIFYKWKKAMGNVPEFGVIGNHDTNELGQDDPTAVLTNGQFHRIVNSRLESFRFVDFSKSIDSRFIYYKIDNPDQKFRTIVLSKNFDTVSNTDEKAWLQEKLTELPSDWSVIVLTHYMWHVVPELHETGQIILNTINAVYSQINAHFVGVLSGHAHEDYSMLEPTHGYNVIATICDGMRSGNIYDRVVGTTSEQAIDLVFINTADGSRTMKLVRIGAGDTVIGDGTGVRTFSYS